MAKTLMSLKASRISADREVSNSKIIQDAIREDAHLERVIRDDPKVSEAINATINRLRERGEIRFIDDDLKFVDPRFTIPGLQIFPGINVQPVTPTPTQPETSDIDQELLLLLQQIPTARAGEIITSEYHNLLRRAVYALAERLGVATAPATGTEIFTFAPNFMRTNTQLPDMPAHVNQPLPWTLSFEKAQLNPDAANANTPVRGVLPVQLPNEAVIQKMIVRGNSAAPPANGVVVDPQIFQVALKRMTISKANSAQTPLITVDLKSKRGRFDETGTIDQPDPNRDLGMLAKFVQQENQIVNNQTHQYFITADWLGVNSPPQITAPPNQAARFEIVSLQIFCAV